jgi:hypothetical protein
MAQETGRGLSVIQATDTSLLKHVDFIDLSTPVHSGLSLTGSVTFYESDVEINHCRFMGNTCEDALNVVRSKLTLSNSLFLDTFGDAVDVDFGTGSIRNCQFRDIGNDAIDVSGTAIELSDLKIVHAQDKGISAGEASGVFGNNLSIHDCSIALASKDQSSLIVSNSSISKCGVGATAYQKKPIFDSPTLVLNQTTLTDVDTPSLIEQGARAHINGKSPEKTSKKVESILYGIEDN